MPQYVHNFAGEQKPTKDFADANELLQEHNELQDKYDKAEEVRKVIIIGLEFIFKSNYCFISIARKDFLWVCHVNQTFLFYEFLCYIMFVTLTTFFIIGLNNIYNKTIANIMANCHSQFYKTMFRFISPEILETK